MTTLTAFREAIRYELSDAGSFYADNELNAAVAKTEGLLSRVIPKKKVVEVTLTHEVSSETLTIASSTATTTYKPIEWDSEVVTNSAGTTTYTRGTDFTIDYMTGVVTEIGSQMADGAYKISYHKDPQRYDLGSLLSGMLKVTRVELPVGDKPPTYIPTFDLIEDFLVFGKDVSLETGDHMRIYYYSTWTGADTSTQSDYPGSLSMVVLIGACGQALLQKAEKYVQSALTEVAIINSSADSMATPLADINTALDKIITYLSSATVPPSAHDYLVDGDDYITTLNVSNNVAEKYADYARASIQIAASFIEEATQRIAEANAWANQADKYAVTAKYYLDIAGRFLASGQAKINEFYTLIGAKPELQQTRVHMTQSDKY
jgi:hypothetical protein